VLLIIPVTGVSAPPSSQDELSRTLEKFVRQGEQQLYKGTFVHLSDDGLQTIRVLREKDKQGEIRESFIPLDNNSPESNRLLKNQYCLLDNGWKYQFQAFSSSFPFRINNKINYLSQNYHIIPVRLERVAGLNARHISFLPRDKFRYGYELWFEPETGILLKYQLINDRKETIEQYQYSNIHILQSMDPSNKMIVDQAASDQLALCSALHPDNIKTIDQFLNRTLLPHGFQIISYRQHPE
jgi:sigma-E factor negative regulatory protein RseB